MSVGILVVTHGQQGACLLESVAHMLGEMPEEVIALSLVGTERRSEIEKRCQAALEKLQQKNKAVLILTDLFGSTQANIAEKIAAAATAATAATDDEQILCAHGVNLVMLLEAVAMRTLPLAELHQQVINAGQQAIRGGE